MRLVLIIILLTLLLGVSTVASGNIDVGFERENNSNLDSFLSTPTFFIPNYVQRFGSVEFYNNLHRNNTVKYPLFIHLDLDIDNSFVVEGTTYYVFHNRLASVGTNYDGGFNISTNPSILSIGSFIQSGNRGNIIFRYRDSFVRTGFSRWDDYLTLSISRGRTVNYAYYYDNVTNQLHLKYLSKPRKRVGLVR